MIYKSVKTYTLFLIFLLMNIACATDDAEIQELKGDIYGLSYLIGEGSFSRMDDNSDVEITLEGSDPQKKAYSDFEGRFMIANLNKGVYNIVYKKEGYGTFIKPGYQFIGGSKASALPLVNLYPLPTFTFNHLEVQFDNLPFIMRFQVSGTIDDNFQKEVSSVRLFLDDQPDVSFENYKETFSVGLQVRDEMAISGYLLFDTSLFPSGSDTYIIGYPTSPNNQKYVDLATGAYIYSGIKTEAPSNVVKITVPQRYPF